MWTSAEVFENDLFAFSEIEGARDRGSETIPQSILEWEARNGVNQHQSVFDTPDLSEDVTYVLSGRGKGGFSTIIRPGVVPKVPTSMDDDLKRKIREVAGLGFSNELIEQTFWAKSTNTITGTTNPGIQLQPTNARSNRSTPNSLSGASISSLNASPKKSPSVNTTTSKSSKEFSKSLQPQSAPTVVAQNAPPLSSILKKAKNDAKKRNFKLMSEQENSEKKIPDTEESTAVNGNKKDLWRGSRNGDGSDAYNSWRRRDVPIANRFFGNNNRKNKGLDIASPEEFPALK